MISSILTRVLTPCLAACGLLVATVAMAADLKSLPNGFSREAPRSLPEFRGMEKHITALSRKVTAAAVGVQVGSAVGSGVVVSADGTVLTVAHVAGRPGREVLFVFSDGRRARGKTLGLNHGPDAGMMKITDPGPWPYADLAPSKESRVGDWVLALGHPGGWDPDRPIVVRLGRILETGSEFLRSDCTITAGDSGGPLFDMQGRVTGLHSFVRTATTANYHVAISNYHSDWKRLISGESWGEEETATRPWLGTRGSDEAGGGCRIEVVDERGPAFKAGLQVGDVVLRINGAKVEGAEDYSLAVRSSKIGSELQLIVRRGEGEKTILVKVAERGQR